MIIIILMIAVAATDPPTHKYQRYYFPSELPDTAAYGGHLFNGALGSFFST